MFFAAASFSGGIFRVFRGSLIVFLGCCSPQESFLRPGSFLFLHHLAFGGRSTRRPTIAPCDTYILPRVRFYRQRSSREHAVVFLFTTSYRMCSTYSTYSYFSAAVTLGRFDYVTPCAGVVLQQLRGTGIYIAAVCITSKQYLKAGLLSKV